MDTNKFADLEATMRMLYDHGNMRFDSTNSAIEVVHNTNASMREPKRVQQRKVVGGKRKTRPEPMAAKLTQVDKKPLK